MTTPARSQVRKEPDGSLIQRNLETGTERAVRASQISALPAASALRLLRIGVPIASDLDTVAANPRLELLTSASKPPPPQSKDDAFVHVAHAAIFDADAVVYGGFVRDYVVCNTSTNDLDVNTSDYDATERLMTAALKAQGVISHDPHVKPWGKEKQYRRVTYHWQGHKLEVDLVDPATVPFSTPGVDCDVGNLALDKRRGLRLKKQSMASVVPLRDCVAHAQAKEFVFFYELRGASQMMALERLNKYLGRGWTCRGAVPDEVRVMLSAAHGALLQPDTGQYSEARLSRARAKAASPASASAV